MTPNRYCERLGIPPPVVERFVERAGIKLLHLMVLALLEHGEPLEIEEVADRLLDAGVGAPSGDMLYSLRKSWHGLQPVIREPDGRMGLDLESFELGFLVRKFGLEPCESRVEVSSPPPEPVMPGDEVPLREDELNEALRRASLSDVRTAAAVLDLRGGPLSFEEIRGAVERLAGRDWRPHRPFVRNRFFAESREGLLTPDPASPDLCLIELRPPRKTLQLNRRGRKLRITPEMVISSSTAIAHPLADPATVARYVAQGDMGRLVRRIEADGKALYAYYRYGVLHGHVRLRWGFVDEAIAVEWALPDEPHLTSVLREALESGVAVDIVTGSAPGWSDPWSRAARLKVVELEYGAAVFEQGSRHRILLDEIQAIRPAG